MRIQDLFARDYSGGDFILFGAQHLFALAVVAGVCIGITLLRGRFTERSKLIFRIGLAALIYLNEGSWHVWKLAIHDWSIQVMLPLWLCSLTSWSMPLLLIWKKQWFFEWAYYMGLIGAAMALLQPDLMNYGFPHFRFIEFFTLHGSLIVAIVYFTVVEKYRPHWKAFPWVLLFTNLYWVFCGLVNSRIGSNYLYTAGRLPTPSLLDVLGPPPWYLLSMEAIGLVLCFLLYMPFALRDGFFRKKPHPANLKD
jgi:hypothetical integral membrane protein (TIGR02206 family)